MVKLLGLPNSMDYHEILKHLRQICYSFSFVVFVLFLV
ncbi:hypothetical protein Patl1_35168 [Pistacia atlantica]|uniref:Uncharacterized protein n=1 Tax=Pistacia atlantica TaxID=434234 RepID=A0ACC0ZV13_9ROSI|nr:hypothetical protein Patl1_35168 [Pistacia atlantica]